MEPVPPESEQPSARAPSGPAVGGRRRDYWLGGGLLLALVVGGVLVIRAGLANQQRGRCLNNVRQLTNAALMYAEDNQARLPAGARWLDRIEGRLPGPGTEQCPSVGSDSGYTFSRAMGNQEVSRLANPGAVPLIFDGLDTSRNAVGNIESDLAVARHGEPNVGYADGSARTVSRGPRASG